MIEPAAVAAALVGKPITTTRIRKCLRHLPDVVAYRAFLGALPEDVRTRVAAELDARVEVRG